MLHGVTRLSTPASLIEMDDEGIVTDITDPRVYREMHGYIPVSHSSHRALFDDVVSREQSEFVVEIGPPAALRGEDDTLTVCIDLLSREKASDELAAGFYSTATALFDGPLGEEICVSSAMVCGVGIVCLDPESVNVSRLTVQDLLFQLRAEIEALLAVPEGATVNERASFFGAACWLAYSLEHLLPRSQVKLINKALDVLEECKCQIATEREINAAGELFRNLQD